ncbi:MAG: hypothetical protein ACLGIN_05485 [Candidatus Sericytochromatia bacterium]
MAPWIRMSVAAGLLLGLSACQQPILVDPTDGATIKSSGAAAGPVTFEVQLDTAAFSEREPIRVSLWDEAQLAISERTADCGVSYDVSSGQEKVTCPPGVAYEKATPEEWTFTRAELASGLTVTSKTVMVGERFRLSVRGKAKDDCNTAAGSVEGLTSGARVAIKDMSLGVTEMGCLAPGEN